MPERLLACEKVRKYQKPVAVLRKHSVHIHPRIGVLLIEEGIVEVLSISPQGMTPEMTQRADLVLTVEESMKHRLNELSPSDHIYTVKEFLGYPQRDRNLPDIRAYLLPNTKFQLYKDRKFCTMLKDLAKQVLEKISATKLAYDGAKK